MQNNHNRHTEKYKANMMAAMTLRTQRNRSLKDANYLPTLHGTLYQPSLNNKITSSNVVFGQPATSTKSAKTLVNYNRVSVENPPKNKINLRTTTLPFIQYTHTPNGNNGDYRGVDESMNVNNSYNIYTHCKTRLSGVTHRHEVDRLILPPNECRLQPPLSTYFDAKKQVNVINLQLNDNQMEVNIDCCDLTRALPQQRRRIKSKTRATQTLYRESSAQTLPYLPGVSNDPVQLETLEVFKLPTILAGDGPPGLYEVEVLERARKRWAFAKALKENFHKQLKEARKQAKLEKHQHILEAFEWEHWIEREEYIQECQMLRLQLLIQMFDKREYEMHTASKARIQKSCEMIEAKRQASLKKNAIKYNRALRRLEVKHAKQPRVWRKENISLELGDPSSEFYAPKMRYGVNPNRRHFTASHKDFDMRMDYLEQKTIKMDYKCLKCPFAKLKQWSKPKEVLQEVEQNFCSDTNLKKLYESLRTLRESSRKPKYPPLCLKAKDSKKLTSIKPQLEEDLNKRSLHLHMKEEDTCSSSRISVDMKENEDTEHEQALEELRQQKLAERENIKMLQREMRCEELEALISSYEGNTIGWLMRFLSEEMCRLKEQRKLHFYTMIAKRERWRREAAEAGLRQKENFMRENYEKLYEECDQTNKEITNKFLNTVIETDITDYAEQKAEEYITTMAKELDKEISDWLYSFREVQNPLNYHTLRHALKDIVIPNVEKILYRLERDDCIDYIINNVILYRVYQSLQAYDISFSIASDIVDRLTDNDLYLNSPDCSSDCECTEFCHCSRVRREAMAIIRKVIRSAVPGRRWRTAEERIVFENINDLLDDVFQTVASKCSITDVDISHPKTNTHLECSENDMIIADTSENNISLERLGEIKLKPSDSICIPIVFDITKSLENREQLLLMDPDKLSADRSLLQIDKYVEPETQPEPQIIHIVPSTLDITNIWAFTKAPTFSQISSDELLEQTQEEETKMEEELEEFLSEPKYKLVTETMDGTDECLDSLSLEMSSSSEVFKEKEYEKVEQSQKTMDEAKTIEEEENPKTSASEEEIIFNEPTQVDGDSNDDNGIMEVLFSYDHSMKHSTPVSSEYNIRNDNTNRNE